MRRVLSIRIGSGSLKIPARLTSAEWSRFKELARLEGRSVTGQVSWLLRRHLSERAAGSAHAGFEVASVARVRKASEVAEDRESLAYWRAQSPDERIAEVERLRLIAYSMQTGKDALPGIVLKGRVVRGRS